MLEKILDHTLDLSVMSIAEIMHLEAVIDTVNELENIDLEEKLAQVKAMIREEMKNIKNSSLNLQEVPQ